jgi:hypothetical protein
VVITFRHCGVCGWVLNISCVDVCVMGSVVGSLTPHNHKSSGRETYQQSYYAGKTAWCCCGGGGRGCRYVI